MKKHLLILCAMAVFVTALATTTYAQTSKTLRVNVQFDFRIGDRIYPAGEYRIETLSSQADNVMVIRNVNDPDKTQIILAEPLDTHKSGRGPTLAFVRDGELYFLNQIFFDSGSWGYSIRPSHGRPASGKDLASRLARTN
jgi:hypothetical protein